MWATLGAVLILLVDSTWATTCNDFQRANPTGSNPIKYCVENACDGGQIEIENGFYTGTEACELNFTKNLTIFAAAGHSVTIYCDQPTYSWWIPTSPYQQTISFSRINFNSSNSSLAVLNEHASVIVDQCIFAANDMAPAVYSSGNNSLSVTATSFQGLSMGAVTTPGSLSITGSTFTRLTGGYAATAGTSLQLLDNVFGDSTLSFAFTSAGNVESARNQYRDNTVSGLIQAGGDFSSHTDTFTDNIISGAQAVQVDGAVTIESTVAHNHSATFISGMKSATVASSQFRYTQKHALHFPNGAVTTSFTGFSNGQDSAIFATNVTSTSDTFTSNTGTENGGAIMAFGWLAAMGSVFQSNTAAMGGGAIMMKSSSAPSYISLTSCTFESNSATNWGGAIHAGMDAIIDYVTISSSNFRYNNAGTYGGALYGAVNMSSATATSISASTFHGNYAPAGGAVYTQTSCMESAQCQIAMTSNTFTSNRANGQGGGAVFLQPFNTEDCMGTTLHVAGGNFDANMAEIDGGAIHSLCPLNVTYTGTGHPSNALTFHNNTAKYGGAISTHILSLTPYVNFTSNQASVHGGALFARQLTYLDDEIAFGGNTAGERGNDFYINYAINQDTHFHTYLVWEPILGRLPTGAYGRNDHGTLATTWVRTPTTTGNQLRVQLGNRITYAHSSKATLIGNFTVNMIDEHMDTDTGLYTATFDGDIIWAGAYTLNVTLVEMPNDCDALQFAVETYNCTYTDYFGHGQAHVRTCTKSASDYTMTQDMPCVGCSPCNACHRGITGSSDILQCNLDGHVFSSPPRFVGCGQTTSPGF